MSVIEKVVFFSLIVVKSMLAFIDVAAIMAIGYLTTSVASIISGSPEESPRLELAGIAIPAVNIDSLPILAGLILGLFLSRSLLTIALSGWTAFFLARIEARAARLISEIRFGGNMNDARKYSPEEMMYAVTSGTYSAFNTLLTGVSSIISEGVLVIMVIAGGIFFVDAVTTVLAILYFGLIALAIQFVMGSVILRAQQENYRSSIKLTTSISNLLAVFRELSVSKMKGKFLRDIRESKILATHSSAKSDFLISLPRHIVEAALLLGFALFFVSQVATGDIASAAGKIGLFLAGGFRLTTAILPIQTAFLGIKASLPSAKIAHDILGGLNDLADLQTSSSSQMEKLPHFDKPIGAAFENVTYYYPGSTQPALSNVNLVIEPGSQTALMGPSGAGKSTIADMLCLLLSPTSGRVTQITNSSNLEQAIGGRVSYVPQKPGMVSGTILENVALGIEDEDVNRDEVLRTLKTVHLGSLIQDLPMGIDTDLGKLKDALSGGQMQRLGLARALYLKPNFLVMDEATSALDAESESEIQKTLEELRGTVTVVVIAHRLNTIQHADKVILLEEGRVQDSGTFKELLARNLSVEKAVELMRIDEGD
jgi:ABC-type multidrug transport system fused ATPase/permease subunit